MQNGLMRSNSITPSSLTKIHWSKTQQVLQRKNLKLEQRADDDIFIQVEEHYVIVQK